jgi:hypothetical protein
MVYLKKIPSNKHRSPARTIPGELLVLGTWKSKLVSPVKGYE